ncbi:MAG: 1-acyl-sn-glycerol-3-phosphate acyltransferase [bacterium]|nr:1-acyl-sn-glycerol-3-phosphate acyltransferase [bacterium]
MSVIQPRLAPGFPLGTFNLWRGAQWAVWRALPRVWDFEVVGENTIPHGPVVIAANHFSHVDPFVAAVAAGRPTRFLGVDELFGRSRFFDGLPYCLGVIPMPRGTVPLQSMRTAFNHLQRGGGVTLFPEGRRVSEWGESPPKQGAAWLAMRVKCPLIPMALWGTGEAMGLEDLKLRRHPVRVAVGAPMYPVDFADRGAMTDAWYEWMDRALIMLGARP